MVSAWRTQLPAARRRPGRAAAPASRSSPAGRPGLGRAVVRELAGLGYDVAVLARESQGLHGAAREVDLAGRRGLAVPVDVADAGAVDAAAERVEAELGPIDVWVNDAMTSVFARFLEIEPDEFERATQVTYLGFVNGTRAALRRMVPRDRGHVVQVGSSLAFRGIPLQSAYCGAKHAMVGFTESVQAELDHDGVDVEISMVHMPALNTPQFGWVRSRLPKHPQPVPPIFQPEVGARAVAYVVQHPRRRTAVTWRTSAIAVGNALSPRLLDWFVAKTAVAGPADRRAPARLRGQPRQARPGRHRRPRQLRPPRQDLQPARPGRTCGSAAFSGAAVSTVGAAGGRTRELLGSR